MAGGIPNYVVKVVKDVQVVTQVVVQQIGITLAQVLAAIKEAIDQVIGWVVDQMNSVYRAAVQWARDNMATIDEVVGIARNFVNEIWQQIQFTVSEIYWTVRLAIQRADEALTAAYNTVKDYIEQRIIETIQVVEFTIDKLIWTAILAVREWVSANFPLLADIMSSDIWKAAEALSKILKSILLFFANPLKVIRDLIVPFLVTWICSAVAHEIDPSIPLYSGFSGPGGGSGGGEIGGSSPGMTGELAWPLDGLFISGNTFGVPAGHVGIDLHLPKGKKVYAMHDGTASVPNPMPTGYGNYVIVSGGKWRTLYAHGERVIVDSGVKVKRGEQIMIGDSVGRSTGDHLHLEIIYNGQYIDPIDVLPIQG